MNKIHKLPPHLIAQIAAGEVIERPSYAVKELFDNAIDAQASEITLQLEGHGLKKIIVTDNGTGMTKEDLLESYKIHTTSKVENEESLTAIKSLGFRGEALASIAAISHLIIKTKTENAVAGHFIEVSNGKLIKDGPAGIPKGTSVEINNIFSEVPARKKFLKSPTTEFRHIIDIFTSFALTFPQIRFTLIHNKKVLYDLSATDNFLSRSSLILSETAIKNIIPFKKDDSYFSVHGFIAKPQLTTTSNTKQILFVNNRRINDKLITQAIRDSYGSLIPDKQQPVFMLFINVPHELVDVNVHPRKEQIAFYNAQTIYETVFNIVTGTLKNSNLIFSNNTATYAEPITKAVTGKVLKESTPPWQIKNEPLVINYSTLQQMHNLYLVVQTKQGIVLVDQHAAHERILFEQYKKEFQKQRLKTQRINPPLKIKLTALEKLVVEEYKKELEKIGFVMNENKNQIIEIPAIFTDRDIEKLIKELIEEFEQKQQTNSVDEVSVKIIQFLACKNAVKAGDTLTQEEGIRLIKKLETTENNFTCPHGRPTKYLFHLSEINKLFKRF